MAQGLEVDLKQLVLFDGSFGPREVKAISAAISADFAQYRLFRDAVQELEAKDQHSPASRTRSGVCLYLLGRYGRAIETLKSGDGGALTLFYIARSQLALERFAEAVEAFEAAQRAGYDAGECVLAKAEALRRNHKPQEALASLDKLSGAIEQTAEYLFQRGATVATIGGNPGEVIALYERAVESDKNHAGALFGLALENDRRGNDEAAMDLYKRSASQFPSHVGALLNLGLLYEDREQYDKAVQCYRRILEAYPNNARAKLYLRDTEASGQQFYDEDAQKKLDRMSQVLNIPVSDYELSVRSRNCLNTIGVTTLGDLARLTEAELLSSKNFGETSLIEIKDMLSSKGLRLGMMAPERQVADVLDTEPLTADEQAAMTKPIADLNLSVRARKCMLRLGITILGDLLKRTGDELLECKNFGVTSLNEVRDKLSTMGLKLRGD